MTEKKQAEIETPCGQDEECDVEPDGFHGKSYKDYLKALSESTNTLTGTREGSPNCECEQVTTYGMVCVNCGKPYKMKTRWTTDSSAGEWHGSE